MIAALAFCFIPLAAFFLCLALLLPQFRIVHGLLACILGLVAVVPIALLQFFLERQQFLSVTSLFMVLLSALICNGLIEESIKMLLLFCMPSKNRSLPLFFCYSMLAGLTLACFESLIYLISGYENIGLRLITAAVIHLTCAALDGLFVYSVRRGHVTVTPFLYAVVLHGVYNYFAGFGQHTVYFFISFAVVLFSIVECRIRYMAICKEV